VNSTTKSPKGAGSCNNCAEYHKITNFFSIGCRKWLCSPQLAANRDVDNREQSDPPYFSISFKATDHTKKEELCAVFSCYHKSHEAAWIADGAFARGWHSLDGI